MQGFHKYKAQNLGFRVQGSWVTTDINEGVNGYVLHDAHFWGRVAIEEPQRESLYD